MFLSGDKMTEAAWAAADAAGQQRGEAALARQKTVHLQMQHCKTRMYV
jgi:hypothetical protein